ncbi:hypothetical protein [Paenibacillus sp. GCM10012306]|uniref:hypothetical protein n=1 Tax=Paenibacillus sp. GCM10012306 TaxID=3317342 RepID=UPI00361682D9
MSCCGNQPEKNHGPDHKESDPKASGRRNLLMKLCCILPMVAVVLMIAANAVKGGGGANSILVYSLLLLCPLSHLVLMPLLMRKKKH